METVQHSINNEPFITLESNTYNELGELVQKQLHIEGDDGPWQTIDYEYNIQGWLTHINDDKLDDTEDLFGMELSYDEGFTGGNNYYDGNITGIKWQTAIDDMRHAYAYEYDKVERIKGAKYYGGSNPGFENTDYYNLEILPENGKISGYDYNGNILNLKRYGLVDGNHFPFDDLEYTYEGNRLNKVVENGLPEGFKDGSNTGDDYIYDANGNMISDANQGIENIIYNTMNLPQEIVFTAVDGVQSKIEYVYDAGGSKLSQRVYTDKDKAPLKITDYVGERVYETTEDQPIELQFIHHENGRIVKNTDLNSDKEWAYQYHMKDHLGNIHLTFGKEGKVDNHLVTMELYKTDDQRNVVENTRIQETQKFENITSTEYIESGEPIYDHTHLLPNPETPDPDDKLYPEAQITSYLTGSGSRVYGPATSLKVMPGDEIDLRVFYKYAEIPDDDNSGKVLGDILLSTFQGTFYKVGGEYLVKQNIINEGYLQAGMQVIGDENAESVPDAYINYIIFDQNFENPEGFKIPIDDDGKIIDGTETHGDISHSFTIDQAGYVYVYLSNETFDSHVYFDDFLVSHTKTRVIQKNDYYPFGMDNMALSFSRDDIVPNRFLYQDQELQDEFDLNWYQFKWRMHNPALGRFSSVDPLSEDYVYNSTYAFSENRLTNGVELEGLEFVLSRGESMSLYNNVFKPSYGVSVYESSNGWKAGYLFNGNSNINANAMAFDSKGNISFMTSQNSNASYDLFSNESNFVLGGDYNFRSGQFVKYPSMNSVMDLSGSSSSANMDLIIADFSIIQSSTNDYGFGMGGGATIGAAISKDKFMTNKMVTYNIKDVELFYNTYDKVINWANNAGFTNNEYEWSLDFKQNLYNNTSELMIDIHGNVEIDGKSYEMSRWFGTGVVFEKTMESQTEIIRSFNVE